MRVPFRSVVALARRSAGARRSRRRGCRAGAPVRLWSVSRVEQGAGEVPVSRRGAGRRRAAEDRPTRPRGVQPPAARAVLVLPAARRGVRRAVLERRRARSTPCWRRRRRPIPLRVGAPKGAITHLDEYQAYEKRAGDASLKITLSDVLLQTIDDNNRLAAWECPPAGNCDPVRTVVRFHARAYAASAGGDFFDAGGVAYLEGHQHSWRPGAATSADSPGAAVGRGRSSTSTATPTTAARARPAVMNLKKPRSA